MITREADLVTAHEFGHNWGSEHDPDITECSPSASQGGSYLMYTYSVSGYDVNNKVVLLWFICRNHGKKNIFCDVLFVYFFRDFHLVAYGRFVKFYKPSREGVFQNRKNRFVEI